MRARNAGLTDRELQVIYLIGLTLPNADIAEQLGVSINSVKSYIRSATGAWGSTRARQPSSGPAGSPPRRPTARRTQPRPTPAAPPAASRMDDCRLPDTPVDTPPSPIADCPVDNVGAPSCGA
ncbi:response regulator transcription factor [Phycicoccus elongatus]|uniref:response regulator transcription factor n=1 Tax=Phycicoccus elongatus TaxID=101689 RepID=UPI003783877A